MKVNYVKTSPSQNMTILITDVVDPKDYVKVANSVMRYESINGEQVGFVVPPKHPESCVGLHMSGGEFCGNALLSVAAYSAYKGFSSESSFFVSSSGAESPLYCTVSPLASNCFRVKGQVPEPQEIVSLEASLNGQMITGELVVMDGISHFITAYPLQRTEYDGLMNALIQSCTAHAIGIIPYKKIDERRYEIDPFVYVRATESRFFERACGSGSLSLGIHLNRSQGLCHIEVLQSGGIIEVEVGDKNYISTEVTLVSEGSVYI